MVKLLERTRAINAGWVYSKDLRVCGNRPDFDGHVILCPLELHQRGTVSKSDADVILCSSLLAEGGLNHYAYLNYNRTPRFTSANSPMVELVATAAKAYDCKLVPSSTKGKATDYYISRNTFKRWEGNPISKLVHEWKINCLATQKTIPSWVFQLPDEQIALFLRVFIDCDGWMSVRGSSFVSRYNSGKSNTSKADWPACVTPWHYRHVYLQRKWLCWCLDMVNDYGGEMAGTSKFVGQSRKARSRCDRIRQKAGRMLPLYGMPGVERNLCRSKSSLIAQKDMSGVRYIHSPCHCSNGEY